jgi:hypothetical protein
MIRDPRLVVGGGPALLAARAASSSFVKRGGPGASSSSVVQTGPSIVRGTGKPHQMEHGRRDPSTVQVAPSSPITNTFRTDDA